MTDKKWKCSSTSITINYICSLEKRVVVAFFLSVMASFEIHLNRVKREIENKNVVVFETLKQEIYH